MKELQTDYQHRILLLEEEHEESLKSDCAKTCDLKQDGKMYSHKMRLIVYECFMANVPTEKMSALILSLAKKFGANLMEKDVPVRSSVENMVVELGLLSNL